MKLSGIYRIVHLPTGREYIGQSVDLRARLRGHRNKLVLGKHHARHLQFAWIKHGSDEFAFEILELCAADDLNRREQHAIDERKPCFNTAPVAGSSRGIVRSEEFRQKISVAHRGRIVSEETRQRMRDAKTPEARDRIRAAHAGKAKSPEHVAKMRAALTGRKQTPEQIANAKAGRAKRTAEDIARTTALRAAKREERRKASIPQTASNDREDGRCCPTTGE